MGDSPPSQTASQVSSQASPAPPPPPAAAAATETTPATVTPPRAAGEEKGYGGASPQEERKMSQSAPKESPTFSQKCAKGCRGFLRFLYNGERNEVLGRGGLSWLKVTIFYVILYASLISFFAMYLFCYFHFFVFNGGNVDYPGNGPKYKGKHSLIGEYPGMGFIPNVYRTNDPEAALIWFDQAGGGEKVGIWDEKDKKTKDTIPKDEMVKDIEKFVNDQSKGDDCDWETNKGEYGGEANGEKLCKIAKPKLCTIDNKFGYDEGSPCVAIKLNRIFGWKPEPLIARTETNVADFNDFKIKLKQNKRTDIPDGLLELMKQVFETAGKNETGGIARSPWIHCDGETDADTELAGKIIYDPHPYIPHYYFPYKLAMVKKNGKNVRVVSPNPYVMVKFENPVPGVMISIECRLYAGYKGGGKDASFHSKDSGVIKFNLMIGGNKKSDVKK